MVGFDDMTHQPLGKTNFTYRGMCVGSVMGKVIIVDVFCTRALNACSDAYAMHLINPQLYVQLVPYVSFEGGYAIGA